LQLVLNKALLCGAAFLNFGVELKAPASNMRYSASSCAVILV
jgi:hypothetical protein